MVFPGLKNGLLGEIPRTNAVVELDPGTTRQDVLDEAVRRFRRQRPNLIKLCLKPSHGDVRQYAAAWIRREYQRILAEGAAQYRDCAPLKRSISPDRATRSAPARQADPKALVPHDHVLAIAG
jgi:hypothetical protein